MKSGSSILGGVTLCYALHVAAIPLREYRLRGILAQLITLSSEAGCNLG